LPIGVLRPPKCPFNPVVGSLKLLETSPVTYVTATARLPSWFNYYSNNIILTDSLGSKMIRVFPNATLSWVYVDDMYAGNFNCAQVESPPAINGSIGLLDSASFLTHQEWTINPSYLQKVTQWPTDNNTDIRYGYNYQYLPLDTLDANGNQVLAWASGVGTYGYSIPSKPNQLDLLITLLGSRQQIPLWNGSAETANSSLVFNRNYAYLCKARWTSQATNVLLYDPLKASAIIGDNFHGVTLDGPLTPSRLINLQQLAVANVMSQFGPSGTWDTNAIFGREISCLFVGDIIFAYYGIGLLMIFGALAVVSVGVRIEELMQAGTGPLTRKDIPITGLGWIHFINNIYNPK
jgi:hypothetical protein